MDATTSTEPYVISNWPAAETISNWPAAETISNWPAAETMLEDVDEDFELLSRSSLQTPSFLNTPSSSLLAAAINDQEAAQDNLLDALSRLEEERSRSVLLQRQVEVARALASLPTSEVPARAATIVAAHWRARAVRIPAARAIADRRNREALAAAKLQTELRAYLTTTLPSTTKSALRREIVRMHGARATDVTSLARKERQIDSMVERQIETFNAHKIANEASATREATLSQALHESEQKVRELRIALETTMEGAKEAVQQQQQAQQHSVGEAVAMAAQEDSAAASSSSDDGSRITSLEALATGLAVDKADLAYALEEMKAEKRVLEERLSEVTLQKDEAEDRASALLAEKLQKESASDGTFVGAAAAHHHHTRGSGSSGGGPLEWPLAAAAAAAVPPLFGCGSEEDLERGGGSWLGASTSSRRSATPPVDLEQPTTPASASMQRSF